MLKRCLENLSNLTRMESITVEDSLLVTGPLLCQISTVKQTELLRREKETRKLVQLCKVLDHRMPQRC